MERGEGRGGEDRTGQERKKQGKLDREDEGEGKGENKAQRNSISFHLIPPSQAAHPPDLDKGELKG